MLDSLGVDPGADDAAWRGPATAWFAERLRDTARFAAFVIDHPHPEPGGPRLLACCAVWLETHLPGPSNPNGLRGHIAGMVTEPAKQQPGCRSRT
jgi:hypothetical protein